MHRQEDRKWSRKLYYPRNKIDPPKSIIKPHNRKIPAVTGLIRAKLGHLVETKSPHVFPYTIESYTRTNDSVIKYIKIHQIAWEGSLLCTSIHIFDKEGIYPGNLSEHL